MFIEDLKFNKLWINAYLTCNKAIQCKVISAIAVNFYKTVGRWMGND